MNVIGRNRDVEGWKQKGQDDKSPPNESQECGDAEHLIVILNGLESGPERKGSDEGERRIIAKNCDFPFH
ncbi:hypothetical protein D3C84_1290420 [compost metagenome]